MSVMNNYSQDFFKKQIWITQECNRNTNFIRIREKRSVLPDWIRKKNSEDIYYTTKLIAKYLEMFYICLPKAYMGSDPLRPEDLKQTSPEPI